MKEFNFLLFLLKMFSLSKSLDTDLMINTIQAMLNYHHFEYYLILSAHESAQNLHHENFLKTIHSRIKSSTIVDIHIENFYKSNVKVKSFERWKVASTESRSLIIFDGENEANREKFVKFSENLNFGGNQIWLIFLKNISRSEEEFLKSLKLPFSAQLIMAIMDGSKNVCFKAPYKVAENYPLRIVDVGKYSDTTGLNLPVIDVATTRHDFEGFRLRAGTWNYPRAITVRRYENGTNYFIGHLGHLWHEISERLNFTYDFYVSNGSGAMLPNGTWNGLIGMLANKEVDVGVMYLSVTKERIDYVDFSAPIMSTGYKIFYLDVKNQFEWGNLFRPFRIGVWLVLLLWFVIISLAIAYFFTAEYSRSAKKHLTRACTTAECFFIAFRAFTNQGTDVTPESLPSRIVLYSAYLTMAVILPAYSAALISYLTIQTPYKPFDSLHTMLEKKSHYLAVLEPTAEYSYFQDSKEQLLHDVFHKLMLPLKEKGKIPRNPEEGVEFACRNKDIAFLINYLMGRMYADQLLEKHGCVVKSVETSVATIDEGFGFQKGSPYSLMINLELKKMLYKGIVRRHQKNIFARNKENNPSGFEEINLGHVIQIYSILLGGYVASVIILLVEIYINRRKNQKFPDKNLGNGGEIPRKGKKSKFVIRKIKSKFEVRKLNSKIVIRQMKSELIIKKIN